MKLPFLKSLPKSAAKYSYFAAWFMVFVSFLMTTWLWYITKTESDENASQRFKFRVEEKVTSIEKRLTAYEQVLLGGGGLFASIKNVTRSEWRNYVEKLKIDENYPGILGIGFSMMLQPSEIDKFINSVRKEGFPDFAIWPKGDRNIYTAILYLEPFKGRNLRAFGYDMFTNPVRKKAMIQARDEGNTSLSGKVTLVQETDKDVQAGFLMYIPIYINNMPINTIEERRKALRGYVYSPFRMNDLMKGILGEQFNIFNLRIYDGDKISKNAAMFNSTALDSGSEKNNENDFVINKRINFNGHIWTAVFTSLPEFNRTVDKEEPLIILIAGIAITLLFLTLAISLISINKLYQKTEQILESTGEGIFGIDLKGYCTFINRAAVEMLGFDPVQSNKKIHELIHHSYPDGTKYPVNDCEINKALKTKSGCIKDNEVFWRIDGSSFPVHYWAYPIIERDEIKGSVVTFTDITERKKAEKAIEDSLKEKDVLLREIHHRVKNNMQIISSLLNLQSSYIQDEHAIKILKESQNRIRSMALIHEKLYQSGNLADVKFKDYLIDLSNHLMRSYSSNSSKIKLITEIENVLLGADTAISLGLIVNELLSNAFKYAFPNGIGGEIKIIYKAGKDNSATLTISDNGIGFPLNINFKQTETLGLQLVNTLSNQLECTIVLKRGKGTEFKIYIPDIK
jgi:PAS domain S-box-containing protein